MKADKRTEQPGKYCTTRERDDSGQKTGKVENAQKVIGKDEVGGSNPPSSSTETPEILGFRVFSFAFCNFWAEYDFADFR